MRSLSAENVAALNARSLVPRDFLWIVARNRDTDAAEAVGFWSGSQNVSAQVLNPDTGLAVSRNWYGAGGLISISDIPAVANITVQTVTITMSQLHELVEQAVRLYDVKLARVEIYRGLMSAATRVMVAPAFCRFVGLVDEVEITTPSENEDGAVTLRCVSHTQEMLRYNPDTRSHESQIRRAAGDDFFKDAGLVGEWEHFWGTKNGRIDTAKPKVKGPRPDMSRPDN